MTDQRWRVALITSVAPIAVALVETLRGLGHEPVAVLTPRRNPPQPSNVAINDESTPLGVDVVLLRNKWSIEPILRAIQPDVVLCWGFPWLIPGSALQVPRLGSVNLHPAMLPRHRGPIPLSWSIRAGDPHYGVTWHRMDGAFDTGAILAQAEVPMKPDDADIWIVGPRVAEVALGLLPRVLERIAAGDPGDPQNATGNEPYADWFDDDYAQVDWSRPALEVDRQVRAWAIGAANNKVHGPVAVIGGRQVLVKRTSLVDPGAAGAIRMDAGDGPIWVVAYEPLEKPAES
jgi:methionyl-tRNA formyltransferase